MRQQWLTVGRGVFRQAHNRSHMITSGGGGSLDRDTDLLCSTLAVCYQPVTFGWTNECLIAVGMHHTLIDVASICLTLPKVTMAMFGVALALVNHLAVKTVIGPGSASRIVHKHTRLKHHFDSLTRHQSRFAPAVPGKVPCPFHQFTHSVFCA